MKKLSIKQWLQIGVLFTASILVAQLIGNKSQKAIDVENRIKVEQLQQEVDSIQKDR